MFLRTGKVQVALDLPQYLLDASCRVARTVYGTKSAIVLESCFRMRRSLDAIIQFDPLCFTVYND